MGDKVPSSFHELKNRVADRIRSRGPEEAKAEVIAMGDAMLKAGVEPKTETDRLAKQIWQSSDARDKEVLADVVTRLAEDQTTLS